MNLKYFLPAIKTTYEALSIHFQVFQTNENILLIFI